MHVRSGDARCRRVLASLALLTLAAAPRCVAAPAAGTAQFLQFTAVREDGAVALRGNARVLMRFRAGLVAIDRAEQLASRLNALALAGLRPGQVQAKPVAGAKAAHLLAAGEVLLTVDQRFVTAGQASPLPLAQSWAANLKDLLTTPYVVLEPRSRLQVPLGERRTVRWGGTAATDLTFASQNPEVAAVQLDPSGQPLLVEGRGTGATAISASLGNQEVALPVEVKAWAARVAQSVVAEVTSPPLPADDLRRTLRNAVLSALKPAATATIELGEPRRNSGDYLVEVKASGPDCFDVDDTVRVDVRAVAGPKQRPQELLISNLPERITEPATLLRERLLTASAVRLLWHHVNSGAVPLRFAVRVANLGDAPARLHVTEAAIGPHDDEIHVGHTAMTRFIGLASQGEGYYLNVPAGRILDLYDVRLSPGLIVSGLATLTPSTAGNLLVEVVAENSWPTTAYFQPVPDRLYQDPPLTPYRFEASKSIDLQHEVGGAWTFYHIGKEYSVNLQGQRLYGDYGVSYTIRATFKNPTDKPARCELSLRASGGVARSSVVLDGELLETGLLRGANEEAIYKTDLQPGAEKAVTLVTIPESGSNYPITLTMRSSQ